MIFIEEALQIIIDNAQKFEIETVPLHLALGRVLAENIYADRDYPPFNRSAMDGYACRAEDVGRINFFTNIEVIYAGQFPQNRITEGTCAKIMTGAPVPNGANAVIRIEDCDSLNFSSNQVKFNLKEAKDGLNIATQGQDCIAGSKIIEMSSKISTAVYSTLAALGKHEVDVYTIPKVVVLSTGNEIKPIGETIEPFQIRDSNSYSIESFFYKYQIPLFARHLIGDELSDIESYINNYSHVDILILSGGVSMGDADYVPKALAKCGITCLFHKVQIKPGKPIWFGITKNQKAVFALPGNPFSVQIALKLFIETYLSACYGLLTDSHLKLPLLKLKHKKTKFDEFFPCKLTDVGQTGLVPVQFNGSGDISAMLDTDGFARHHRDTDHLEYGEILDFIFWY